MRIQPTELDRRTLHYARSPKTHAEHRVHGPAAERRDPTTDVSGEARNVVDGDEGDVFVPGDAGELLEVEAPCAGKADPHDAGPIPTYHDRLDDGCEGDAERLRGFLRGGGRGPEPRCAGNLCTRCGTPRFSRILTASVFMS